MADYYDIEYSRYINDIVKDLEHITLATYFNNWIQGVVGQPQNLNRVSLYIGNCGSGKLKISNFPLGIYYTIDRYSDGWYQSGGIR